MHWHCGALKFEAVWI